MIVSCNRYCTKQIWNVRDQGNIAHWGWFMYLSSFARRGFTGILLLQLTNCNRSLTLRCTLIFTFLGRFLGDGHFDFLQTSLNTVKSPKINFSIFSDTYSLYTIKQKIFMSRCLLSILTNTCVFRPVTLYDPLKTVAGGIREKFDLSRKQTRMERRFIDKTTQRKVKAEGRPRGAPRWKVPSVYTPTSRSHWIKG